MYVYSKWLIHIYIFTELQRGCACLCNGLWLYSLGRLCGRQKRTDRELTKRSRIDPMAILFGPPAWSPEAGRQGAHQTESNRCNMWGHFMEEEVEEEEEGGREGRRCVQGGGGQSRWPGAWRRGLLSVVRRRGGRVRAAFSVARRIRHQAPA